MTRKVIFWLAPNEVLIPADQVPGAIADAIYPRPERKELAGQAPNDPNAVKRLEAEREQSKQLCIKFPHLKDGDKFSIGDLNDYLARLGMVAKIRQRREAIDHLDPEGRWARRQFEDGFNAVREPVVEARRSHLELSDKQCTELAGQRELFIDHWIELVGVGIGQHESYDIARDGVAFRKWEDKFISESPNEWQIDMERDNRIAPHLAFPCTPAELVEFVDNAIGIHCFGVPDAFRVAATARAQAERCNELATLPELLVHHWIELTGIGICKGGTYSVGQSGVYPKQYSDADFLCTLSPEESRLLLERACRPPLIFPCTPSQLLKFADGGLQGEFEVPDDFRAAVEARALLVTEVGEQNAGAGVPEQEEPATLPFHKNREQNDAAPTTCPKCYDIESEKGCRRMILENWEKIVLKNGNQFNGTQALRHFKIEYGRDAKLPVLKTIQNRLKDLRNEKLIP